MQPGVVYTTFHHADHRRQCGDDRQFRLGDQLPGIQGDRGAGPAHEPSFGLAGPRPGGRGRACAASPERVPMPPNEGAASIEVETRSFSYDSGAVEPAFQRAVAVEAPVEIRHRRRALRRDDGDAARPRGFRVRIPADRRGRRAPGRHSRNGDRGGRPRAGGSTSTLTGAKLKAHLARKRAIGGRTGCGLCGVEDLSQLPSPRARSPPRPPIEPSAIGAALAELEKPAAAQRADPRRARCRLVRPRRADRAGPRGRRASQCARQGDRRAHARQASAPTSGFFVITSRCSFEMVAKAAIFGAGTLVSVSAPTSLALARAREYGVSLIAVARADKALSFDTDGGARSGGLAA